MFERMSKVIEKIKNQDPSTYSDEANTKQGIILPILYSLEWDIFDTNEVYPEYYIEKFRVDYALRNNNSNEVFIEVKKYGLPLDSFEEQLINYTFRTKVKFVVLTNGISWWFYLPTRSDLDWKKRKFYSIDLFSQDPEVVYEKFNNLLSKKKIINGEAIENANQLLNSQIRNEKIKETLPLAWDSLISEPDPLLVELIMEKTEKICGFRPGEKDIIEFLEEKKIDMSQVKDISNELTIPTSDDDITQDKLIPYIIYFIGQNGGKVTKKDIEEKIFNHLKDKFSQPYWQKNVSSGIPRWKHYIAWAKQRAVDIYHYIKKPSETIRGIWELTSEGIRYYNELKNKSFIFK